ncbi:hypothetical protein TorRG33x02_356470, partial [Trema orientale]
LVNQSHLRPKFSLHFSELCPGGCPYRKATVFQFSELCPEISARFRSFRYLGWALNSQFREFQRYTLYLWLDYK